MALPLDATSQAAGTLQKPIRDHERRHAQFAAVSAGYEELLTNPRTRRDRLVQTDKCRCTSLRARGEDHTV